jgi:hypothetical protein
LRKATGIFFLSLSLIRASGQTSLEPPRTLQRPSTEAPYTLRVTTREVIIEVVARERDNHPVTDLKETDLQIFEIPRHSQKLLRKITSFHTVDPSEEETQPAASSGGFQIKLGGGCAISTTFHYQLAFQPSSEGWKSGYHEVLVTTTRSHVTISYRHRYYVGEMDLPTKPRIHNGSYDDMALQRAACYHAETPRSIALNAHLIQTAATDPFRYSLVIQPDSLAFASLADQARRVQLDYGACTFDAQGKALSYLHSSAERILTPEEDSRIRAVGFANLIDLPRENNSVLVRFVVRDRETGNLGSIDVATTIAAPVELTKAQRESPKQSEPKPTRNSGLNPVDDNVSYFGSIVPKPNSMCGDVYELPEGTRMLPSSFWDMDAVGAVYTYSLNQPYQFVAKGLPGVTSRPEWFAIDYHGVFWIKTPGEYRFLLTADDGAKLYIDDRLLIDEDGVHSPVRDGHSIQLSAGRHTIHVPYFQQMIHVALFLQIKPPNEEFHVFDLQDFPPPTEAHQAVSQNTDPPK